MVDKVTKRSRIQSKKSIKHLLERQRRARINYSLSELKNLVLSAIHQGNPQVDLNGTEKMEKAEILELTVNYIKAIKGHTNPG
ncbi:enhancer of split mdelta protein-like isoform X2 [Actinia tenebrosa]|uniref:Enhancer of split mdelta protein-like isoform X2 n=1 Tax=Actinia tenebrosa TaxID=6105 RepID=A0A6P8I3Z5_ACTTE|nr:enhancer of split mdelta protein-like isoform X2 [Actinia tenebrosa]